MAWKIYSSFILKQEKTKSKHGGQNTEKQQRVYAASGFAR